MSHCDWGSSSTLAKSTVHPHGKSSSTRTPLRGARLSSRSQRMSYFRFRVCMMMRIYSCPCLRGSETRFSLNKPCSMKIPLSRMYTASRAPTKENLRDSPSRMRRRSIQGLLLNCEAELVESAAAKGRKGRERWILRCGKLTRPAPMANLLSGVAGEGVYPMDLPRRRTISTRRRRARGYILVGFGGQGWQ